LTPTAIMKFNKRFKELLTTLLSEEEGKLADPKFTKCFMDLAEYLKLKDKAIEAKYTPKSMLE